MSSIVKRGLPIAVPMIVVALLVAAPLGAQQQARQRRPGPGAGGGGGATTTDPWCAILNAQGQERPHHCRPLSCEQCPANGWLVACNAVENLASGLGSEPLVMWGSILSFVGDHATDFLCGPGSSFSSYTFAMHNTCDSLGQSSQECQAAKLVQTCVCMGHEGARNTYRSQMSQYCDKCACWRQRTYSTYQEQLDAAKRCLNQQRPRPGRGRAFGDPNLVTLDGQFVSDQRAGEFTAVRRRPGETGPDLDVQLRYEPWGASSAVSMVTAVAIRYGDSRLAVYARPSLELRVGGVATTVPADGLLLESGVEVYREDGYFAIYLPNGDLVTANGLGDFINVSVELTEDLQGRTEGVLGNFDGNAGNDPSSLPSAAHRITTAEASLFDYRSGESLEAFNLPDFPGQPFDFDGAPFELRAASQGACATAQVTDAAIMQGCIRDQMVTNGDTAFLNAAREMQIELSLSVATEIQIQ